ncbi:hypothetical protein D3C79_922220 [compost metagenome]
MLAHHVVQVLALAGGVQFGEMAAGYAAQEPFLKQQRLGSARLLFAFGGQGFQ